MKSSGSKELPKGSSKLIIREKSHPKESMDEEIPAESDNDMPMEENFEDVAEEAPVEAANDNEAAAEEASSVWTCRRRHCWPYYRWCSRDEKTWPHHGGDPPALSSTHDSPCRHRLALQEGSCSG